MQNAVRISHPKKISVIVNDHLEKNGNLVIENSSIAHWESEILENPGINSFSIDFGSTVSFNLIELLNRKDKEKLFPSHFTFEISEDGKIWETILQEIDFQASFNINNRWNFPLVKAHYLRFVCKVNKFHAANKYQVVIGNLNIAISGVEKLEVSSELDRLWVKENLFDERPEYGWSSKMDKKRIEEFFLLDLGAINRVCELRVLTKDAAPCLFPENFIILASEDDITWFTVLEETHFLARPANWYRWRINPTNIRYLKFVSKIGALTLEKQYMTQMIEFEMYAQAELLENSNHSQASSIPYSSLLHSGLVRLARDGEENESVVVQGSDRRLKDANTEYKGIVELATDGEDKQDVVVQGNDRRLKHATEDNYGITRLCPDGFEKQGFVVQGSDSRLKAATEESSGIVELAKDGESRPSVVVQGNDVRLKEGSEEKIGLIRFAKNGETIPNRAVQGNDSRLKDATTQTKGILQFAGNGGTEGLTAVQGNDKRLQKATTTSAGIVELANDGQSAPALVVQSNDKRLKDASFDDSGLVKLCPEGKAREGAVVLGTDPRLSDKREAIAHEHDYAERSHAYDSHYGKLHIEEESDIIENGIVKPTKDSGLIHAVNTARGSAITAQSKGTAVQAFSEETAVQAYSKDTGIIGAGIKGAGAIFISQEDYALKVAGKDLFAKKLYASGKGILSGGSNLFEGKLEINDDKNRRFWASYLPYNNKDVPVSGDCLCIVEEKNNLPLMAKSKRERQKGFLGIAVKDAPLVLGDKDKGMILVAIGGIVKANAEAKSGKIEPGDSLVLSRTDGHLRVYRDNMDKVQDICAKALTGLSKDKGKIKIAIR